MTFYSVSNPFPQILNLQGTGLNDGDVYFGVAGQDPITHPKIVYWDLAGTQVASQPIPTTGGYLYRSGTPANVYIDDTYSVKVLDKNGGLVYYQANVFDPVFEIAQDLAAFEAAIAAPTGSAEIGYSLGSSNDSTQTVQDRLRRFVVLTDFDGVVGDGTTDCSDGILDAIAWAVAENGGNTTFFVPHGEYKITKTISLSAMLGIKFVGQSNWSSQFVSTVTSGVTFDWDGSVGGGMDDIECSYATTPGAGAIFHFIHGSATSLQFKDLRSDECWTWFKLGDASDPAYDTSLIRPVGTGYNGGQAFIHHRNHLGGWIEAPRCPVAGVNSPTVINRDPANVINVVAGTTFLLVEGSCDTLQLTGGGILQHWDRTIHVHALGNGEIIQSITQTTSWYSDYPARQSFYIQADAGTGGIIDVEFLGYGNSWSDTAFEILANGLVRNATWRNPRCNVAGKQNVKISGANHQYCGVVGNGAGFLEAGDRINAGLAAIDITGGARPIVKGVKTGIDGTYGTYPWQAKWGLSWGAGIVFPEFEDITAFGTTAGFNPPVETIATGGKIGRNLGNVNYAGTSPFPGAVPTFASQYTHLPSYEMDLYWFDGTSVTAFKNGNKVGNASGMMRLQSGDMCYFGSATDPTLTQDIQP